MLTNVGTKNKSTLKIGVIKMQILKRLGIWFVQGIIGLVFVIGGAVFLVEYMAGCGETYKDSKGRTHQNECLFVR